MSDTQPDLWTAGNKTRQWLLANVVLSILFMNIPSLVGAGMVLAGERLPHSRLGELQCAAQTQQWAALYGGAVAILFWALLAVGACCERTGRIPRPSWRAATPLTLRLA